MPLIRTRFARKVSRKLSARGRMRARPRASSVLYPRKPGSIPLNGGRFAPIYRPKHKPEVKYTNYTLVNQAVPAGGDASGWEIPPSSGGTGCLTCPAQGDGAGGREGRRVTFTEVDVSGYIYGGTITDAAGTGPPEDTHVFVALVQDTQTNGTQLNSEQVFQNTTAVADVNAFPMRRLEYMDRFKVLACKTITIPVRSVWDGTNITSRYVSRPFQLSWKGRMESLFNGSTASIADVVDNSIQIVACETGSDGSLISYMARSRFVD